MTALAEIAPFLRIARLPNGKPTGGAECIECGAIGPVGELKHTDSCPLADN